MSTVTVTGISSQTSEKEIRDFFSFCGKIQDLKVSPDSDGNGKQTATVTFEKETAAKTAQLLNNTQLGPSQVMVKAASALASTAQSAKEAMSEAMDDHHIAQDDKPRRRIAVEYLAHGYVLTDDAINRLMAMDEQHGLSARFMEITQNLNNKTRATEKAQAVDTKLGVSTTANSIWNSVTSFVDAITDNPTGHKLRDFYTSGVKQVTDVHNEAKHLAELKKKQGQGQGQDQTGANTSSGTAAAGDHSEKQSVEPAHQTSGSTTTAPLGQASNTQL